MFLKKKLIFFGWWSVKGYCCDIIWSSSIQILHLLTFVHLLVLAGDGSGYEEQFARFHDSPRSISLTINEDEEIRLSNPEYEGLNSVQILLRHIARRRAELDRDERTRNTSTSSDESQNVNSTSTVIQNICRETPQEPPFAEGLVSCIWSFSKF